MSDKRKLFKQYNSKALKALARSFDYSEIKVAETFDFDETEILMLRESLHDMRDAHS